MSSSKSFNAQDGGSTSSAYTKRPHSSVILWLALAISSLACIRLAYLSHNIRITCFDDTVIHAGWTDSSINNNNLLMDYSIGRFYAPFKFAILGSLQGSASPLVHTLARIVSLLIAASGAAWFCSSYTGHRNDSLVATTLFLSTYPYFEGYQAFFSNPLLLLGLGAICTSAVLFNYSNSIARACGLVLFALALFCHEVFIPFLLLHLILLLSNKREGGAAQLRQLAPAFTILIAYCALYFSLRIYAHGTYDGVQPSLNPHAFAKALCRYSLAGLPGAEIWFDRNTIATIPIRSESAVLAIISNHTNLYTVVLSLAAGWLVYYHLSFTKNEQIRTRFLPVIFLLSLVILPNVLPSITVKYQIWAMQRRIPYYYGTLGLTFLYSGLFHLFRFMNLNHKFQVITISIIVLYIVLTTQAMNPEVVSRLIAHPIDTLATSP